MKKNYKVIIIGTFAMIFVVLCMVVWKFSNERKNSDYLYYSNFANIYDESGAIDPLNYLEKEEHFVVNKKASSLTEQKSLLDYTFSEFKAVDGEDGNRIVIKMENNTGVNVTKRAINLKLLNEAGDTVDTIYMVIPDMEVAEVLYLNGMTDIKVEEVFDYEIEEASLDGVTFLEENDSSSGDNSNP